ncbi:YraN family protein [Undibacterium sp.]|uniref:YraN family protein n=1 Tax=Undibacterium sp. TaxID=1914977 RepID=UPI00374DA64A
MPVWEWLNRQKQAKKSAGQSESPAFQQGSDKPGGIQNDKRTSRQQTGDDGEQRALQHLQQAGLVLVERNFLCKGGELDLVMQDRGSLVFVEVRSRASSQFGGALASVTPAKQRRMVVAAQVFLQRYSRVPACRFDLICIQDGELEWLQDVITGP